MIEPEDNMHEVAHNIESDEEVGHCQDEGRKLVIVNKMKTLVLRSIKV